MRNSAAKHLETYSQPVEQQTNVTKSVSIPKIKKGITPGEGILLVLFLVFFAVISTQVVAVSSSVYETNAAIQETKSEIAAQEKVNTDLKIEVSELSTYERIWEKAKASGLEINENNVKVVEKP